MRRLSCALEFTAINSAMGIASQQGVAQPIASRNATCARLDLRMTSDAATAHEAARLPQSLREAGVTSAAALRARTSRAKELAVRVHQRVDDRDDERPRALRRDRRRRRRRRRERRRDGALQRLLASYERVARHPGERRPCRSSRPRAVDGSPRAGRRVVRARRRRGQTTCPRTCARPSPPRASRFQ